jgi:hypothetical protein
MRTLLKEPFLHFLLIGAVIFLLYHPQRSADRQGQSIVIDDSDIERLAQAWEAQRNRPPTSAELNGLLEQYLKQEVYYREALKMQLDHNDEIVKRRLYQKMEFLLDEADEMDEPDEKELRNFYESHADQYLSQSVISLNMLYFNPDKREDAKRDALESLAKLSGRGPDISDELIGDPPFFPAAFKRVNAVELGRILGSDFAENVLNLEAGSWQGPLLSGYGVHLVYITERMEGQQADWEEVKDRVRSDYIREQTAERNEMTYWELRKKYKIVLDAKAYPNIQIDQK